MKKLASTIVIAFLVFTPVTSFAFFEAIGNAVLGTLFKVGIPTLMTNLTKSDTAEAKQQKVAIDTIANNIRNSVKRIALQRNENVVVENLLRVDPLKDTMLMHFDGIYLGDKAIFVFAVSSQKERNEMQYWANNHPSSEVKDYQKLTTHEIALKFKKLTSADLEVAKNMTISNIIAATQ